VATGAWIGLAWLTRPNGAALLPFIALWLLLAGQGSLRTKLAGVALLMAVSLAVAAPWIVRNYLVMGKPILTTTMSGAVLFGSNNERILAEPDLHGDWVSPCEVPGAGWTCALDEIGRDEAWSKLGREFVLTHLSDLPQMIWWRFLKFWHLYPFRHGFPEVVGHLCYVAVATLAIVGSWLLRKRWRRTGVLWSVIACFMVTGLMFWGGFRIRIPAEPALIALAAVALASTARLVRGHRSRQQEC
jgi:4-amino-4-deoxy-L-arabinose transferase-like glycosyltransferase